MRGKEEEKERLRVAKRDFRSANGYTSAKLFVHFSPRNGKTTKTNRNKNENWKLCEIKIKPSTSIIWSRVHFGWVNGSLRSNIYQAARARRGGKCTSSESTPSPTDFNSSKMPSSCTNTHAHIHTLHVVISVCHDFICIGEKFIKTLGIT